MSETRTDEMDRTGISNRETPAEEARERTEHAPELTEPPEPQDVTGRVGDTSPAEVPNRQTAHKAGVRSIAQKEDEARYPDRSMPPAKKVPGAFGKEPPDDATEPRGDQ